MMKLQETFSQLDGKNVSLFHFEEEVDSPLYLKWLNDLDVVKTIGRNDYLQSVSKAKLREYVGSLDRSKIIFTGIYYSETQKNPAKTEMNFVGTLKIYDIDFDSKKASLGIMIGEKQLWGRGIASEAIILASEYCFYTLGFHKVCAGFLEGNTGMSKAFKNCGFETEGVLRDHFFDLEKFQNVVLVGKIKPS